MSPTRGETEDRLLRPSKVGNAMPGNCVLADFGLGLDLRISERDLGSCGIHLCVMGPEIRIQGEGHPWDHTASGCFGTFGPAVEEGERPHAPPTYRNIVEGGDKGFGAMVVRGQGSVGEQLSVGEADVEDEDAGHPDEEPRVHVPLPPLRLVGGDTPRGTGGNLSVELGGGECGRTSFRSAAFHNARGFRTTNALGRSSKGERKSRG